MIHGVVRPRFVTAIKRGDRIYWYHRRRGYRTFAVSLGVDLSSQDAVKADFDMRADAYLIPVMPPEAFADVITKLISRSRARAASLKKPFDLTADGLKRLLADQRNRCALSGIAFSRKQKDRVKRRMFLPSVDRIDCDGGYTMDNIRLVVAAVNIGLADFGDKNYLEVCRAVVAYHEK